MKYHLVFFLKPHNMTVLSKNICCDYGGNSALLKHCDMS